MKFERLVDSPKARTSVVTDVAGDHVSKSQESTGGDFGAPYCSLLSDSITWFFEQRQVSSMRFWIAFGLPNGTR